MLAGDGLVPLDDAMLNGVVQMTCSGLSGVFMGRFAVLAAGVPGDFSKGSFEKSSREVTENPSLE